MRTRTPLKQGKRIAIYKWLVVYARFHQDNKICSSPNNIANEEKTPNSTRFLIKGCMYSVCEYGIYTQLYSLMCKWPPFRTIVSESSYKKAARSEMYNTKEAEKSSCSQLNWRKKNDGKLVHRHKRTSAAVGRGCELDWSQKHLKEQLAVTLSFANINGGAVLEWKINSNISSARIVYKECKFK